MFNTRRYLSTIITPGQGIVSHESIAFYKPYLTTNSKVKELITITDEVTKTPISSIFYGDSKLDFQKTSLQQPLIILLNSIQKQVLLDQYDYDLYRRNATSKFAIGHSVGEITNLALQECIPYEKAISIAHRRGLLMEKLVSSADLLSPYKMYVLIIDRKNFSAILEKLVSMRDTVAVSNINSDEQIVISGTQQDCLKAIETLSQDFKLRKKIDLQVSIPFHNSLLAPIVEELYELFLETKVTKWLKIASILNLDGSKNQLVSDYIGKILSVTYQTVDFKTCIDKVVDSSDSSNQDSLEFIHYSPVTKNLVDRYLKTQKIPFKSYSLDSEDNIAQFIDSRN